ncbi:DUF4214 domain-containing protein [Duganella sp. FT3S]|uniref:DUF4214 domain-containing protein n=1 Tax=Rugamonas fusca TaxID=2758568 RepID=A0A7W2EIR8_9BURK|nr:DUF4214 domain-containing protein [Rugamonas fusca]MBA5606490.1 DUF4214 domain-containing protein [Rugamonas fusca]
MRIIRAVAGLAILLLAGCGGDQNNATPDTTARVSRLGAQRLAAPAPAADYGPLVQQLYLAYFGRAADSGALPNFEAQLAALGAPTDIQQLSSAYRDNAGVRALIDSFGESDESRRLYSGDTETFVRAIYQNVLGRAPLSGGLAYWIDAIDHQGLSRANASLSIMGAALVNASAQGLLDAALINKRVAASASFTSALNTTVLAQSYSGKAAADQVRAMLAAVSGGTDLTAFQAVIDSTLLSLARSSTDRPDDASGSQVHVVYAVPAGTADRRLDLSDQLVNSTGSFNNWLATQTGGRRLRFDTAGGRLDVTFVSLPRSDADYEAQGVRKRDTIEADLVAAGLVSAGKIYTVYYEGSNPRTCADAPRPPYLAGQVMVMYLHGLANVAGVTPCDQNHFAASPSAAAGYLDFAMLHEIVHTLGGASDGVPNQVAGGHVNTSPTDLMYAGPLPWQPSVLDANKSNYYNPAGLPAGLFNLAQSSFLMPPP